MIANGYDTRAGQARRSLGRGGRSFRLPHDDPSVRRKKPKPAYTLHDLVAEVVAVRSIHKHQVELRGLRGEAIERAERVERKDAATVGHPDGAQVGCD